MTRASFRSPVLLASCLNAWMIGVLAFLYLPIVLLVAWSFNASETGQHWAGFTTRWYGLIFEDRPLLAAVENSLLIATVTTGLSIVLGTGAAWLLHRFRFPASAAIHTMLYLPMIIPEIIMGVSLMLLFRAVDLELGYLTVIIAHVTFCFPFVMASVQARLAGLDPALEEAALDLGATPSQAFVRVILPYLMPAIVAGGLLSFTLSLDEFIVTFFTCSAESMTFPVKIYGMVKPGLKPTLNAVSTLFIVGTTLCVLLADVVRSRGEYEGNGRFMKNILCLSVVALFVLQGCHREERLHLFAWSEYVPQKVIDGFTSETGIPVDYEVYDSNEAMLSKLSPGSAAYDLVQPSEYAVEHLIHRQMLAPIDMSLIPNVSNLAADYRDPSYDPGQKYSVPYMSGTVGIVVNTAVIKEPIRSYADVFQEKYKKRIVVLDDNREIVSWAFSNLKIPINDVTKENLQKARPLLKQWLRLVKVFDSTDPKRSLRGGDVDIGIVYNGDAAMLYQEDKKFQYVLPAEGSHRFIDNLCIPAGSRHQQSAAKFINYILKPEVSKLISDKFPYTNPNAAARKLLSPAQLDNPASYPPSSGTNEIFHDIGPATQDLSAMMTELRSEND